MRITVIRENGTVLIDGKGYTGVDVSSMPSDVLAMQWYGDFGEEEPLFQDVKPPNVRINNLDAYSKIIENWNIAKAAEDKYEADLEVERNSPETKAEMARVQRNYLLRQCDWTQMNDIDPSIAVMWKEYRQALRDITSQPGFPLKIVWPIEP